MDAPDQAERRERPLVRRRRITARPARLRIRRRNPCFFFRFRLFGWYVRFTHGLLETPGPRWGPGAGARHVVQCTRAQVNGRVYGHAANISNPPIGHPMPVLRGPASFPRNCWHIPASRDSVPLPRRTTWPRPSGLLPRPRRRNSRGDASNQARSSPDRGGGRRLLHTCGHSCGQSGESAWALQRRMTSG